MATAKNHYIEIIKLTIFFGANERALNLRAGERGNRRLP
jgi:hypothetical protein